MSSHHTSQNHLHDSAMYNIAGGMYDMRDIIVINNYHISYSAAAVRLDGSDESNHAQAAPSTTQDHEPDGLQSSGSLADGATESAVLLVRHPGSSSPGFFEGGAHIDDRNRRNWRCTRSTKPGGQKQQTQRRKTRMAAV
ncbi:hypothetical protein FIBSPDRAFT_851363 [Athelia psychrophila]|uniref:Uncharacterized protein n=1 Tax=Athelia psychrophila TaxID=1759441 RepID=A0A166SRR8_9AGAM|nr:hypothetical protein FIBSPDRAFT_851363 [Fibularhizoctonia sp. CBS 109695]